MGALKKRDMKKGTQKGCVRMSVTVWGFHSQAPRQPPWQRQDCDLSYRPAPHTCSTTWPRVSASLSRCPQATASCHRAPDPRGLLVLLPSAWWGPPSRRRCWMNCWNRWVYRHTHACTRTHTHSHSHTHMYMQNTLLKQVSAHAHLQNTLLKQVSTHAHLQNTLLKQVSTHAHLQNTLLKQVSTHAHLQNTRHYRMSCWNMWASTHTHA